MVSVSSVLGSVQGSGPLALLRQSDRPTCGHSPGVRWGRIQWGAQKGAHNPTVREERGEEGKVSEGCPEAGAGFSSFSDRESRNSEEGS